MGRKSLYNKDIETIITEAIADQGTDEAGYKAAGINHDTFYTWLKKYPEFNEAIARARNKFKETCPSVMRVMAKERMLDLLKNGQVITWERTRAETQRDGRDRVLLQTSETVVNVERRPTPSWVLQKILPNPIADLNDAIKMIQAAGYVVIDPTIPPEQEQKGEGLTQENAEAIKGRILGIASDPVEYEQREEVYS